MGCPDYNLKGTLELSPGAEDTAAPADDSGPLYIDTGGETGDPPPEDPVAAGPDARDDPADVVSFCMLFFSFNLCIFVFRRVAVCSR